jgi:hypothetical protein
MKRSIGVTLSAVIAFLGSGTALLCGILMFLVISLTRMQESQPHFVKYVTYAMVTLLFGFCGWGTASGIGLLRLRGWARISTLVYSGLLLFFSLPGLIMILVITLPMPPNVRDPELFRQSMMVTRAIIAVIYGILISLSIFWLYLFNTRTVREQFKGVATLDSSSPSKSRRPISIAIIGWYLLLSACFFPITALFHFPIFLFGFFVKGSSVTLIVLVMCLLQFVMGVGLLKLKPWARILSIWYFGFFAFNTFAMVLVPGTQGRFEEAQADFARIFATPSTVAGSTPSPMHIPMWVGLTFTVPLLSIVLWFLVKSKCAFTAVPQPSSPLS